MLWIGLSQYFFQGTLWVMLQSCVNYGARECATKIVLLHFASSRYCADGKKGNHGLSSSLHEAEYPNPTVVAIFE